MLARIDRQYVIDLAGVEVHGTGIESIESLCLSVDIIFVPSIGQALVRMIDRP